MSIGRRRLAAIVAALVALQLVALWVYRRVEHARTAPTFQFEQLRPHAAPDITLLQPDGSTRQLAETRGKVVLLHFWATWCPPCREELPRLLALGRRGRFQVICVSLDKDWMQVRKFFNGEIPPEVFRDAEGASTDAFGLSTLPDTYLVASDGSLLLRFHGAREWDSDAARAVLESHAGAP